jgi:hypothetical protein
MWTRRRQHSGPRELASKNHKGLKQHLRLACAATTLILRQHPTHDLIEKHKAVEQRRSNMHCD